MTQATIEESSKPYSASPKKASRFGGKVDEAPVLDKSLYFQFAIHGRAVLISILLREVPKLPGGLPAELLAKAMSVGEILVTCHIATF